MTLQEILNSDVDARALIALGRRGLRWWVDELAAMAPPGWRALLSARPRTTAEPVGDGVWRYWRDGKAVGRTPPRRGASEGVGLLIPRGRVLVREESVPNMPLADVRRMMALDLDRLSPLGPELVHFDVEVIGRDAAGRQRVALAIAPRDVVADLAAAARAQGMTPASLAVATEDGRGRFDFLPAMREASGEAGGAGARTWWWGAVAALLVVNLAVLVGRDMADVANLRQLVDAERPAVNAALHLRHRVEGEEARRAALLARGARAEPLAMLSALTEATPAGAWIQHLDWNGRTLRIVGFKPAAIDMEAAVRGAGLFANPRSLAADTAAAGSGGQPFDITADVKPRAAP